MLQPALGASNQIRHHPWSSRQLLTKIKIPVPGRVLIPRNLLNPCVQHRRPNQPRIRQVLGTDSNQDYRPICLGNEGQVTVTKLG